MNTVPELLLKKKKTKRPLGFGVSQVVPSNSVSMGSWYQDLGAIRPKTKIPRVNELSMGPSEIGVSQYN